MRSSPLPLRRVSQQSLSYVQIPILLKEWRKVHCTATSETGSSHPRGVICHLQEREENHTSSDSTTNSDASFRKEQVLTRSPKNKSIWHSRISTAILVNRWAEKRHMICLLRSTAYKARHSLTQSTSFASLLIRSRSTPSFLDRSTSGQPTRPS